MRQLVGRVVCDRCHRERDLALAPVCLVCNTISAKPLPRTKAELNAAIGAQLAALQALVDEAQELGLYD